MHKNMDDSQTFSHFLHEWLNRNSRSSLWLAQRLGVDETAVQAWLDGQRVPEDSEIITQIEQLLNAASQNKDGEESHAPTPDIDNRSKGVYFEKTGDVRIGGDVVGGDQTNYHQYFGPESPLTTLFKMLDSATGWSKAPPEIRWNIGRRLRWSVNCVYRAHPWFWRLVITAVFLLLFSWLFLWPYAWRPRLITQLNTQGTTMIQVGEYTQAIQILERAVRLYPKDARSHYNLGNAYDSPSGNEDRAIDEFKTTITLDDRFWPAYNNLARLQIQTEKPDAALETLRAGLRLESEIPTLEIAVFQKNMGWAFLGQVGRQECPFSRIVTVSATHQATVERALTLLEEAQDQIQTSREADENVSIYLAEVYMLQGCAYDALGQPEKASIAWSDSLAHAAAVLSSKQCAGSEPQLFDCLKAEDWATRLADRVGSP